LVVTEVNYVEVLQVIDEVFVQELKTAKAITEQQMSFLFSNVAALLKSHQTFLSKLQERKNEPWDTDHRHTVGDLFLFEVRFSRDDD